MRESLGLVGDIGGTHCRFALTRPGGELIAPVIFSSSAFEDAYSAIAFYLEQELRGQQIAWAVVAVAGAIEENSVELTNRSWRISAPEIGSRFNLSAGLVNDFAALAAGAPMLEARDLIAIGGGAPSSDNGVKTIAVVGPGTGLGVGGLVQRAGVTLPLSSEGGHAEFAPLGALQVEIAKILRAQFGRVSNERLLSGEGLSNIHWALSAAEGLAELRLTPQEISHRAANSADPLSLKAISIFSSVLGSFAGDVVLTLGARGGLYVAGGMINKMLGVFDRTAFRTAFEAKGRFSKYTAQTPTWIMAHPYPALIGAGMLATEIV